MNDIFAKDLSGEMVSPDEPGYDELIADIFATIKTATEMNTGYRTPEEVHEYMERILDKELDATTTVLPPLTLIMVNLSILVSDVSSSNAVRFSDEVVLRLVMMCLSGRKST